MAIELTAKPNTTGPSLTYPYGQVKDNTGAGDGTPVNKEVFEDYIQFFHKMFATAQIVDGTLNYNNVPDSAYDGFQFFEAFLLAMYTAKFEPLAAAGYTSHPTNPLYARKIGAKTVRLQGQIYTASGETSVSTNTKVAGLGAAYSPVVPQFFTCADTNNTTDAVIVEVNEIGDIRVRGDMTPFDDHSVYINITYDID